MQHEARRAHPVSLWGWKLARLPQGEPAMPIHRVQSQRGIPFCEFMRQHGSEEQCTAAPARLRWPQGFRCPRCAESRCYRVPRGGRVLLHCAACRHQGSPTAGSMMGSPKLPLTTRFLAIPLLSQAGSGLSARALLRRLGESYRSAWMLHHKVMEAMAGADERKPLSGDILSACFRRVGLKAEADAKGPLGGALEHQCPSSGRKSCRPMRRGRSATPTSTSSSASTRIVTSATSATASITTSTCAAGSRRPSSMSCLRTSDLSRSCRRLRFMPNPIGRKARGSPSA